MNETVKDSQMHIQMQTFWELQKLWVL